MECCIGYEVVFMDIDMPIMDGIEVRRSFVIGGCFTSVGALLLF